MAALNVLVDTFPPFNTLNLPLPPGATLIDLTRLLAKRIPHVHSLSLTTPDRSPLPDHPTPLAVLAHDNAPYLHLRLTPTLPGGKGGFGSQLRAAGGRMSSQKTSNNDSCRDLSGRRLSTIKEAKKYLSYPSTPSPSLLISSQ